MKKLVRKIDSNFFFSFFFKLYLTLNKYYVKKFLNKNIYINKIYYGSEKNNIN